MTGRSRRRGKRRIGFGGRRLLPIVCLFSFACQAAATTHAWGMRCGGDIVSKGDTKSEVLEACGVPACVRRPMSATILKSKAGIYWPLAVDEEWVYNFGPHRFIQGVRFYQGEVVDTEAGGYGSTDTFTCEDSGEGD